MGKLGKPWKIVKMISLENNKGVIMSVEQAIDTLRNITFEDIKEVGIYNLTVLVKKLQKKIASYETLEVLQKSGCSQNLLDKIVTIKDDVYDDLDLVSDEYEVNVDRKIQFENCTLTMLFSGKGKIYRTNNDYSTEMDCEFDMGIYDSKNDVEYEDIDEIACELHKLLFGEADTDTDVFRDEIMKLVYGMEDMDTEIGYSGYLEDALKEYKWWEKKPNPKTQRRYDRISELVSIRKNAKLTKN